MTDIIDTIGGLLSDNLGVPYAGQEPQDKDSIPTGGLVIVERIGGGMTMRGRTDRPWIQLTVLAVSKKKAFDLLRDVRAVMSRPRVKAGSFFIYGVREVLNPEEASLTADPFYRVRCAFEIHMKGLA